MMQITVDPSKLSQEQKEAVAGFILAFPKSCSGSCHNRTSTLDLELNIDTSKAKASLEELAQLAKDQADTTPATPAQAFKVDADAAQAAQAFGANQPPLAVVPSTVIVGVQPTAQEGMQAATLTQTMTASVPSAPNSAPVPAGVAQAPLTPAPVAAELDKAGLPWDNRIHAGTKTKTVDGAWKKKKGVDAGLVAQVEAELRQLMGAPAAPLVPQAPAASPAPILPASPPAAPVTAPLPTASASPVAVPPAPSPAPASINDYVALIGRVSAAMQAGKLAQGEVDGILQQAGIPQLQGLAVRLDLVGVVAAQVDALIAARG